MAGIRFDRYPVSAPSGSPRPLGGIPSTINVPVVDVNAGAGVLTRAGAGAADAIARAAEKRQALIDQTTLAERYMQATAEMESLYSGIQFNADTHATAPDVLAKTFEDAGTKWYDGLRPELETALRRELVTKQIEYAHKARQLQNAHLVDKANATVVVAQSRLQEEASRLDQTDAKVFEELIPQRDELGQVIKPSRFESLLDGYVQLGLMKAEQKEKLVQKTLEDTAYARAVRLSADSPQRYLDLMRREEAAKGSTFLNYVDPVKRTELLKSAEEKKRSLQRDAEHTEDRARANYDRHQKEQTEVYEARLDQASRDGTLTPGMIDDGVELRLLSGEKAKFFRDSLQSRTIQGGPGNPAVIQRFETEKFTTKDPVALRREILATPLSSYPLEYRTRALAHLEERARALEGAPLTMKDKYEKAKDLYRESLRVQGPMAAIFSVPAQQVLTQALEELDRNAVAGFPEDPMELYFRRRTEYMARLGAPAQARLADLHKQLRASGYVNVEDAQVRVSELLARRSKFASEDAFLAEVRRLKDLEDLEFQLKRFLGASKTTGNAGAGKTPVESAPGYTPPVSGPRR